MKVTFVVECEPTAGNRQSIYLWAREGWFIFPCFYREFILTSERVPLSEVDRTRTNLLMKADMLYQRYIRSEKAEISRERKDGT